MRLLTAVALLVLLAGCGGDPAPAAKPSAPAETPSTSAIGLRATCDQLAEALPADSYEQGQMRHFLDRLVALNNAGDQQVRTALKPLAEPVAALAAQISADQHAAFLDALSQVSAACQSAGSTSLG